MYASATCTSESGPFVLGTAVHLSCHTNDISRNVISSGDVSLISQTWQVAWPQDKVHVVGHNGEAMPTESFEKGVC